MRSTLCVPRYAFHVMRYNNLDLQFITCPTCKGAGKNEKNKPCLECGYLGLGVFSLNRFFYWKIKFNKEIVKFNFVKRFLNKLFNIILYLFGLLGVASLAFWFLESGDIELFSELYLPILLFWLGMLALMFVYYRKICEKSYHRIGDTTKKILRQTPNNWSELKQSKNSFKVDVAVGLSSEALKVIERSFSLADKLGHSKVEILHLFSSLLTENVIKSFFARLNVDQEKLKAKIVNQLSLFSTNDLQKNDFATTNDALASVSMASSADKSEKSDNSKKYKLNDFQPEMNRYAREARLKIENRDKGKKDQVITISNSAKKALIETYLRVCLQDGKQVEPLNFLLSFEMYEKNVSEILYDLEVDTEKIINCLEWFRINKEINDRKKFHGKLAKFKPGGTMDRAYMAVATPILDHFSYDLTKKAKYGQLDFCVNREKELGNIFENFISGKLGCMLVGEFGVGKNTVVSAIAQLMVEEKVPDILRDKRLLSLDIARLVSGTNMGEAQERLLVVIDEISRAGNIILYIENVENIVGIQVGSSETLDLSEVLSGALERNLLYCIASTTPENYTKHIEGRTLGNVMSKIKVEEPSSRQAIQILESKVGFLEFKYKVYFSYNALERIVYLSDKYMHNKKLPQKAVEILESVAVKCSGRDANNRVCTKEDVANAISEITGIPLAKIGEDESKKLLNLESEIHKRMIGQVEAVKNVAASLRRARVELREGKRPIASFLFLGPTGVGKTELAKIISEIYFNNERNMIRLDMSEYQHVDSVKKMIGSADGTLGYLTEAVRRSPFAIILLDEFEKANPKIMDLFLQVIDDGRLTDGQGRTIDFTNCIIIATSNAGSVYIQEQISINVDIESIKKGLIGEYLNKVMRPELINRFDGLIVFKPLTLQNVADIARLMLNKIEKMLNTKGISFYAEEQGVMELAKLGFDPAFGARPLRRLLQQKVENIIADKILAGAVDRRDIVIINKDGNIEVEKARKL